MALTEELRKLLEASASMKVRLPSTTRGNTTPTDLTSSAASAAEREARVLTGTAKAKARRLQDKRTMWKILASMQGIDTSSMTDALIDQAIAYTEAMASLPQLGPTSEVWSMPADMRRLLGYYTNAEREFAAELNNARSNTFFGGVMPNFGPQFAYYNPGAEMDAYRQTALYMPNALAGGVGMGTASATESFLNGIRSGWNTAGNYATRAGQAMMLGARAAAPVVTSPRWAYTTAAFTVPMVADAVTPVTGESDGGINPLWYLGGYLAFRGGRRLFNRYARPKPPKKGRPAGSEEFSVQKPEREVGELEAPRAAEVWEEPVRGTFVGAEPTVPRPTGAFAEVEPYLGPEVAMPVEPVKPGPKPRHPGTRPVDKPKNAKKIEQWEKDNAAYKEWVEQDRAYKEYETAMRARADWEAQNTAHSEWASRRDAHAQAENEWANYDRRVADFDSYHLSWVNNHESFNSEEAARYAREKAAYDAEQAALDQAHTEAVSKWNLKKSEHDAAWSTYKSGPEYEDYLKRLARLQTFKGNLKDWAKENWFWDIVLPGGVLGYALWPKGGSSTTGGGGENKSGQDSTTTANQDSTLYDRGLRQAYWEGDDKTKIDTIDSSTGLPVLVNKDLFGGTERFDSNKSSH